jgi:hypothetical protein
MASTSEAVNAFAHFSNTCSASSFGPAIEADESAKSKATADAKARMYLSRENKIDQKVLNLACRCTLPLNRGISAIPREQLE